MESVIFDTLNVMSYTRPEKSVKSQEVPVK